MTPIAIPRRRRRVVAIPLAPLVDMQLLLLIFFMVTSTYAELEMIPIAESDAAPVELGPVPAGGERPGAVLVRIAGDGTPFVSGVPLAGPALAAEVARRLAEHPGAPVLVLPSARASVQSLVDVLGALAASGATAVEVVRFAEAAP
jgi:biopolymer transport protein ExbD